MKVYVDFKELDAEDMPGSISKKYNLQVRSINSGSDYKNVQLVSLSDYTKQVRKEVCEKIREIADIDDWEEINGYTLGKILDQIQGENNG